VVLGHSKHHREGLERAAVVANVRGRTLRAAKTGEQARDALRAAFAALAEELQRLRERRRRVVKRPGPRPQGTVKRIFRDAGYGFLHFRPGRDVYFQRSALRGLRFEDLRPGSSVEFEIEEGERGLVASKVFPCGERDLV
jgi:CspA family cold shock protein